MKERYYPIEERPEESATGDLAAALEPPCAETFSLHLQGVDIHDDDRARLEEGAAIAAEAALAVACGSASRCRRRRICQESPRPGKKS